MREFIKVIELDFVNAYLVDTGNGFVLIDTGMFFHWERLEEALKAGECVPGSLKLVVITHGDRDHIGNCTKLQEKYKVPVAIHEADVPMARDGLFLKRRNRTLAGKIHMFLARLRMKNMPVSKFEPDILLKDGQSLKEYGFDAKVLHLPGHTKGSIGILTKEGDLFSGDTLINQKKPDYAIYIENFPQLKNSLRALNKLKIRNVYPGHGKMFASSDINLKSWKF